LAPNGLRGLVGAVELLVTGGFTGFWSTGSREQARRRPVADRALKRGDGGRRRRDARDAWGVETFDGSCRFA
jgi:hypothetical protein